MQYFLFNTRNLPWHCNEKYGYAIVIIHDTVLSDLMGIACSNGCVRDVCNNRVVGTTSTERVDILVLVLNSSVLY